jgi:hypothetical protein
MNFIEALFKISWEGLKGGVWHDRVMVLALWLPILIDMILNLSTLADANRINKAIEFLSTFTQPLSI